MNTGRRVTLAEVAARAGVSRSLASLVIRDDPGPSAASRDAVLRAAAELGYTPDAAAKLLRQQRSRLIGTVFDPGDPFHADLLEAAYRAAEERRYEILLSARTASRPEERAVQALVRNRCEALVLFGAESPPAALAETARRLPVVVVGQSGAAAGVDGVRSDDQAGIGAAVDHLVGLGHRRIRFVDGGRRPGATERRRGYRDAMRRHGLPADVVAGDHTEVAGARAADSWLADPERPVTALLASNDRSAVGALDTLRRAGCRVPDDVSVVGYDDSRLSRLPHVDLTSVSQDAAAMAALAVGTVVDRLDGGVQDGPGDTLLEPHLVVRSSSGPAPA